MGKPEVVGNGSGVAAGTIAREYTYGATILHKTFRELFGEKEPQFVKPKTVEEYHSEWLMHQKRLDSFELRYMAFMLDLRKCLRIDFKMILHNIRGVGYKILLPKEQHSHAFLNLGTNLLSSISKADDLLVYINKDNMEPADIVTHEKATAIIQSNCEAIKLHIADMVNKCSALHENTDSHTIRTKMGTYNSIFKNMRHHVMDETKQ